MAKARHIVMVAAENGALEGAKVGGIGDVIGELPPALAARGVRVTVITPSYGFLHRNSRAQEQAQFQVPFGTTTERVFLYRLDVNPGSQVRHWVIDHPLFAGHPLGRLYTDDADEPFATDASKFALFCAAVAEVLCHDPARRPDAIHLHDWHAAGVLLLREYSPRHSALKRVRCVFSIHNLGLQGVRPLAGNLSSLQSWFPALAFDPVVVADPRWRDCYNPVLTAIRCADKVHTVSPNYAREIQRPNAVEERGFHGGEGLESALQSAAAKNRLVGILNGCDYPEPLPGGARGAGPINGWVDFLDAADAALLRAAAQQDTLRSCHYIAHQRLHALRQRQPARLLTSVSRVSAQKTALLLQADSLGSPALHGVLSALGEDGLYIFLGSGQRELEQALTRSMAAHPNFLFLNCFAEPLADALYRHGDLFLMPSTYEPCGLGQMLAMRAGQPCLVHAVGGLADTVEHGKTGLCFRGESLVAQADQLVLSARTALRMQRTQQAKWVNMKKAAARARFLWSDTAAAYLEQLYELPAGLPLSARV